jgi:hypothetical protein
MPELEHVFGFGDKPSKKKTKSNPPYFEPPELPPPNHKKWPKPTSEDEKNIAEAERLEKQLALSAKLDPLARAADEAQSYFSLEAGKGSLEAAEYLFWTAYKSVQLLQKLYSQNPELVRRLARQQIIWPAFVSTHSEFNKSTTSYVSGLELGRESGLKLKKTRWSLNNPYSKAAYILLKRVSAVNEAAYHIQHLSGFPHPQAKAITSSLRKSLGDDARFLDSIPQLGLLAKGTLSTFRPILREMYLQRIPHPERLKCFTNLAGNKDLVTASQKREKIIEWIMQRLSSLLSP